jgi:hypothetical protein
VHAHEIVNRLLEAVVMPTGSIRLEWEDTDERTDKSTELLQQEVFRRFSENPDGAFLFLGFRDDTVRLSPSLEFLRSFCGLFSHKLSITPELETIRHEARVTLLSEEIERTIASTPPMTGAEYLTPVVLNNLWERLHAEFSRELCGFHGTVQAFIKQYSPAVHLIGRVYFHLVESKKDDYPFAFLATYSTGLDNRGASRHLPLKHALQEFGAAGKKMLDLLITVQRAARESSLVAQLIESGELFHPLAWSAKEAFTFLKEIPLYEQSGILCRIPDWWKRGASDLRVNVSLGQRQPSSLGMDALLSFDIDLHLGGEMISAAEVRRLIDSAEGLALIKNRWIAVDPDKLRETLALYEQARKTARTGGLSFRDALRLQMNPQAAFGAAAAEDAVTVTNGEWLETVMTKMRRPEAASAVRLGPSFKAELRPYQQSGVAWLSFLHSLGFGMCLADDMGLGKTIQVLALLHSLKERGEKGASLLVVPASLIANWAGEIRRFAPDLLFFVAHPAGNEDGAVELKDAAELDSLDLVITTYGRIYKYDWMQKHVWKLAILDEAQAIKNPGTKQTKGVKKLRAANRIVLTGTPVENRLSDLWSLFDFLNPGLLGSGEEFGRFSKKLAQDPGGYARLRKVISPYILRRLKTDKTVISDLPDKVEMKTYAALSKKQAVLYRKLVQDLQRAVESAEGIQRKGLILSSLLKFKQICNHPDHYTGSGAFDETESGKFERMREICETIYEKRERVLVFTQFREMTEPLRNFLSGIFNTKGLVLHGGTAVGKRNGIVERFQGDEYVPFLVLSLKAGGVGLNLTAANHVIHFDRWWNPAVENQATDRAFRIGQKKNVLVHKFITKGTVEEKIDEMIEGKVKLSNDVIQSGSEAWITEMSNEELMKVFTLTV